MVKPLNEQETSKSYPIYPEQKQGIFCGISRYNGVQKLVSVKKRKYRQFYNDLPAIFKDQRIFEKIVSRFGFRNEQTKTLLDPSMKDCREIITDLQRLCKKHPQEIVFAFSCYACHGMIQDGRQVILVNQINQSKGFYTMFGVEENVRNLAQMFKNSYNVVVYACCREIFLVASHCGGISLD